jgi:hypothetical protein
VISLQSEIKRHEAGHNVEQEGAVLLVKGTDFIVLLQRKKKIFVFDVCAYLIQVSELHTHFRRITTSTHIPKINTLRCIGLYPTLCLLQIQNSGKVNHNVVKPMRF